MSVLGYLAYGSQALYENPYVIDFWAANNAIWPSTNVRGAARGASQLVTAGVAAISPRRALPASGSGSSRC